MDQERKIRKKFEMKRRRVVLSIKEKAKIIEDFEKGLSTTEIKIKYKIPDSTAYDLKKNQHNLKEEIARYQIPYGEYGLAE